MFGNSEEFWNQYFKQQAKTKPPIEDVIPEFLDGENKKAALEFVAYLRGKKMNPRWATHNVWKPLLKGKPICRIRLPKHEGHFRNPKHSDETAWMGSWCVMLQLHKLKVKFDELSFDEGMKNFICDNLFNCAPNCTGGCNPNKTTLIFGKEIENRCGMDNGHLCILNPDETEMIYIKTLLELEIQARNENDKQAKKLKMK